MANVRLSIEGKRGCGYRKGGGIYLVAPEEGRPCCRFPILLEKCPCCGGGIKQARGWTWMSGKDILQGEPCKHLDRSCPAHEDHELGQIGLLWIGERHYPDMVDFIEEAKKMGISRRIPALPYGFQLGVTWVALAHPKAIYEGKDDDGNDLWKKGIFRLFKPTRIEYVVRGDEDEENLNKLEKRGFTLVKVIPDHFYSPQKELFDDLEENPL